MHIIANIIVNCLAVFLTVYLLPGVTLDGGYEPLVITALLIGVLNSIIKPLVTIVTLPISLLTLGLFSFIVSGAMIMLADYLIDEFHVAHLGWAILFSIVLTVINSTLHTLLD